MLGRLLLFLVLALWAVRGEAAPAKPVKPRATDLLIYHADAALSLISTYDLVIDTSGKVDVLLQPAQREVSESFVFRLNRDELEALKAAVHASDFFALPANLIPNGQLHGCSTLTVTLAGKRHSVIYGSNEALRPLARFVDALLMQAQVLMNLKTQGPEYLLQTQPLLAGGGVLQPRVFREPLQSVLVANLLTKEQICLVFGVQALASATTPTEFAGFFGAEIERATGQRRYRLLSLPGVCESEAHKRAVAPLLYRHLQVALKDWEKLPAEQREALRTAINLARYIDYGDVLTALASLIEKNPEGANEAVSVIIAVDRPEIIAPLLEHQNPEVRSQVAQAMGNLSRLYSRKAEDGDAEHWRKRLQELRELSAPKLLKLAENDTAPTSRDAARNALRAMGVPGPAPVE